ncbi:MFP1 attachment factor 1-like [Primulina eburnea]|uniref:MFP1 attachment factor 1-like n=1 Tax=Primulina eburnea TaxID=1245227 RepID=UPI003C6C154B
MAEPQPDATASKHTHVSFSIWPPTERTRDAVRNRIVESLTIVLKREGTLSREEAFDLAKRFEEEVFESVCETASTDDDGIEILFVYYEEISQRMLKTVKARSGESWAPAAKPANEPTPKAEE